MLIMSRLKKSSSDLIAYLKYRDCIAKSTDNGMPGLSVQEHSRYAGEVAKELIKTPTLFMFKIITGRIHYDGFTA